MIESTEKLVLSFFTVFWKLGGAIWVTNDSRIKGYNMNTLDLSNLENYSLEL